MTHQTPANWRSRCAALAVSVLTLAGCATQQVTDYAQAEPKLDFAQYFNGRVEAHGMFQDRGGQVVKRFTV